MSASSASFSRMAASWGPKATSTPSGRGEQVSSGRWQALEPGAFDAVSRGSIDAPKLSAVLLVRAPLLVRLGKVATGGVRAG